MLETLCECGIEPTGSISQGVGWLYCIVLYCNDGVFIAAQCTATFSDLLCTPEFRYYQDVKYAD